MEIAIIGCGWLGLPLGRSLVEKGHRVWGSTTTPSKLEGITESGINSFLFDMNSFSAQDVAHVINCDLLILTIPPQKKEMLTFYGAQLSYLVELFSPTTNILFTSSTGVYPQVSGVFSEDYDFSTLEKNSAIKLAEEALLKIAPNRLCILRLAGLIGSDRHPIHHVSGKTFRDDGMGVVNLIHQNDLIKTVNFIVENNLFGEIFNVVDDEHPTKIEYYASMAEQLGLEPPIYGELKSVRRIISGEKLRKLYAHDFQLNTSIFEF